MTLLHWFSRSRHHAFIYSPRSHWRFCETPFLAVSAKATESSVSPRPVLAGGRDVITLRLNRYYKVARGATSSALVKQVSISLRHRKLSLEPRDDIPRGRFSLKRPNPLRELLALVVRTSPNRGRLTTRLLLESQLSALLAGSSCRCPCYLAHPLG